jgi:DNA-binding response OmpR family regulator
MDPTSATDFPGSPPSPKILLVEDDLLTANIYRNYLVVEGYTVETAGDGKEAVKILENFSPQVAIVDLMLPGNLKGIDLIKRLRASVKFARIQIIVLSHFKPTVLAGEAWTAGANFCLPKNCCGKQDFLSVVKKALGKAEETAKTTV